MLGFVNLEATVTYILDMTDGDNLINMFLVGLMGETGAEERGRIWPC